MSHAYRQLIPVECTANEQHTGHSLFIRVPRGGSVPLATALAGEIRMAENMATNHLHSAGGSLNADFMHFCVHSQCAILTETPPRPCTNCTE
jgi:hypothetical protein